MTYINQEPNTQPLTPTHMGQSTQTAQSTPSPYGKMPPLASILAYLTPTSQTTARSNYGSLPAQAPSLSQAKPSSPYGKMPPLVQPRASSAQPAMSRKVKSEQKDPPPRQRAQTGPARKSVPKTIYESMCNAACTAWKYIRNPLPNLDDMKALESRNNNPIYTAQRERLGKSADPLLAAAIMMLENLIQKHPDSQTILSNAGLTLTPTMKLAEGKAMDSVIQSVQDASPRNSRQHCDLISALKRLKSAAFSAQTNPSEHTEPAELGAQPTRLDSDTSAYESMPPLTQQQAKEGDDVDPNTRVASGTSRKLQIGMHRSLGSARTPQPRETTPTKEYVNLSTYLPAKNYEDLNALAEQAAAMKSVAGTAQGRS